MYTCIHIYIYIYILHRYKVEYVRKDCPIKTPTEKRQTQTEHEAMWSSTKAAINQQCGVVHQPGTSWDSGGLNQGISSSPWG